MPIIKNIHGLDLKGRNRGTMKIKCPWCSDDRKNKADRSLSINLDKRVFKCHHCEKRGSLDGWKPEREYNEPVPTNKWHKLNEAGLNYLLSRGISERVMIRNKLFSADKWFSPEQPNEDCIGIPYFDEHHTKPRNVKFRAVAKKMWGQEKDCIPLMYNIHEWCDNEEVIIVEGEMDVMSLNTCEVWNVTSPNAGAINPKDESVDGKLQCLYNSHAHFENKKKIILFCDRDPAGQRLERELIAKLGAYRCYTVKVPDGYKDANEVLIGNAKLPALGKEALLKIIQEARPVPISGVIYIDEIEEEMLAAFRNGKPKGSTTYIPDLDERFLWKRGELNVWEGWANFGKTTFCLHAMLLKSLYDGWKWLVFSPENYPPSDFYDDLIEMYVGKHVNRRHNNQMTEAEYKNAMAFVKEHFIYVYPDEEQTIENLHEIFQSLIIKHGIHGVLIDPFNQLDSDNMGIREDLYISKTLKKIKRFALEHGLFYNIIVHPKGMTPNSDGSKPVPTSYSISGGAMWANKTDNIIIVHRPNWETNKEDGLTQIITEKIKRKRTGGSLGECFMVYEPYSARYRVEGGTYYPMSGNAKNTTFDFDEIGF